MFKCDVCRVDSRPGEKVVRVVAEKRQVTYPSRWHWSEETGEKVTDDPGGEGWEIVREKQVCPRCVSAPSEV